jgi:hypothetical protein
MIPDYITISEFRKTPIHYCRSVSAERKEYIVTSNSTPIFRMVKPKSKDKAEEVGVNSMRKSLSDFHILLEKYSAVNLTAYGKTLVRCVKL